MNLKLILVYSFVIVCGSETNLSSYKTVKDRSKMLGDELKMAVGGNIELDEAETKLNNILMKWKHEEFDYWFDNPNLFNFSKIFFEYKEDIKKSKVYQLIEKMPKGGLLHVHASAILDPDFFMNATYRDNLFVCFEQSLKQGNISYWPKFKFNLTKPDDDCGSHWQLISDFRRSLSVENLQEFDKQLRCNFTLVGIGVDDADITWKRFANIFVVIGSLLHYRPVWDDYWYKALQRLAEDKIMYVEIRTILFELYELDGTKHDEAFFVNNTINIIERFKDEYPEFLGAKIIGSYGRRKSIDEMKNVVNLIKNIRKEFPDFIAGFDLIGHEDLGGPLIDYLPVLEEAKSELDYFFHAGETNWFGTSVDENLFDAVLLGSKRIGHGYALMKHPLLLEEVKKRRICVEVCVISNSVLGLMRDARAHPLASLLAWGVTSVVAGDDPGLWGAPPISADMYVTFMGVAGRRQDLRLLKQLALSSIQCSALSATEKQTALAMFSAQWNKFVRDFVENATKNVTQV